VQLKQKQKLMTSPSLSARIRDVLLVAAVGIVLTGLAFPFSRGRSIFGEAPGLSSGTNDGFEIVTFLPSFGSVDADVFAVLLALIGWRVASSSGRLAWSPQLLFALIVATSPLWADDPLRITPWSIRIGLMSFAAVALTTVIGRRTELLGWLIALAMTLLLGESSPPTVPVLRRPQLAWFSGSTRSGAWTDWTGFLSQRNTVVLITGLLLAISLPSFFSPASKAGNANKMGILSPHWLRLVVGVATVIGAGVIGAGITGWGFAPTSSWRSGLVLGLLILAALTAAVGSATQANSTGEWVGELALLAAASFVLVQGPHIVFSCPLTVILITRRAKTAALAQRRRRASDEIDRPSTSPLRHPVTWFAAFASVGVMVSALGIPSRTGTFPQTFQERQPVPGQRTCWFYDLRDQEVAARLSMLGSLREVTQLLDPAGPLNSSEVDWSVGKFEPIPGVERHEVRRVRLICGWTLTTEERWEAAALQLGAAPSPFGDPWNLAMFLGRALGPPGDLERDAAVINTMGAFDVVRAMNWALLPTTVAQEPYRDLGPLARQMRSQIRTLEHFRADP
jgi:hypothetical protein